MLRFSSEDKARSLAVKARTTHGLGVMEPVDTYKVFAMENVSCIKKPMDSEVSGAFVRAEKADVILINTAKTIGHQNFTAAHELYHCLFEKGLELRACRVGKFDLRDEQELVADYFATHFLMPEEGIRYSLSKRLGNREVVKIPDVIFLEQLYGVSHLAMLKRLVELDIIDSTTKEEFLPNVRNNAIALGYGDSLYRPSLDSAIISEYAEKVAKAYEQDLISFSRYEELLAEVGLDFQNEDEEVTDFVD